MPGKCFNPGPKPLHLSYIFLKRKNEKKKIKEKKRRTEKQHQKPLRYKSKWGFVAEIYIWIN